MNGCLSAAVGFVPTLGMLWLEMNLLSQFPSLSVSCLFQLRD